MTAAVNPEPVVDTITDVQGSLDYRQLPVQRAGIKDYRHPVEVIDRSGTQHCIAKCNLDVSVPAEQKGAHLSRFISFMHENYRQISIESFRRLPIRLMCLQGTDASRIEISFIFFMQKIAPVSGIKSVMDYDVTLIGRYSNGRIRNYIKVNVPVTSLCPCSKEISDYGAHNQRSHVSVTAEIDKPIWIENIIELIESNASAEVYSLLKREDEKYLTEKAYDNPKFVEDMVRDMAIALENNDISRYMVEVENFESIHNHSAYAMIDNLTSC